MDLRAAPILFLVVLLFFAGCAQKAQACATNGDCPPGSFCIDERCSSLSCSQEGGSCASSSECCGSLACVNGACQSIPELEKAAKVIVKENGKGYAYGAVLDVGEVSPIFGANCELLGGSAEIELKYGPNSAKGTVSVNGSIFAGKAYARLDAITGNVTPQGKCAIRSKRAAISVSKSSYFDGQVPVGSGFSLGDGTFAKLLKVEPSSSANIGWKEFSLASGQGIPGEQITVSISGTPDSATCTARGGAVSFSSKTGSKPAVVAEGDTGYAGGKPVAVDSIEFFTSDCTLLPGGPVAKIRMAPSPPCRYPRTATFELGAGGAPSTVEVGNDKPSSFGNVNLSIDSAGSFGTCIDASPKVKAGIAQADTVRIAEGTYALAFGNTLISLDKLDVSASGTPCAVTDAEATVSATPIGTPGLGSAVVRKGKPVQLSGLTLSLQDVMGELSPSGEPCSLSGPKLLVSIVSPQGSGGVFGTQVPAGSTLFIESETERSETALSGVCPGQGKTSVGYVFDKDKRAFSSVSQPQSNPATVAYGAIRSSSGGSGTFSSALFTGDSIPFEQGGFKVIGVNKEGDASVVEDGAPFVLSAGESVSTEKSAVESFSNCSIGVKTTETLHNYGFVNPPG